MIRTLVRHIVVILNMAGINLDKEIQKAKETQDERTKEVYALLAEDLKNKSKVNEDGSVSLVGIKDEVKITKPINKKRIMLPGDDKLDSTFANEVAEIMKGDYKLFHRSETSEIVEIGKIRHYNCEDEFRGFKSVTPKRFITLAEKYFIPWRYIYKKDGSCEEKIQSMKQSTADIVLVSDDFQDKMPVINRIFTFQQPILLNKKLIFPKVGYDQRLGSWLSYESPKISNQDMELEEAKLIINDLYKDFCFKDKQDLTNAISALLTPGLRGLYSIFNIRDPIFFYRGNRERVGKDYCAGVPAMVYEGCHLEESPISNGERGNNSNDEFRKKIISTMIEGRKRFHSSNNKGLINNAVLEGVTTSLTYSDRLLGKNKTVKFDNEITFSLSGNMGTSLTPDLANRSIFINLFFDKEDANSRIFSKPDLHGWILKNRELILSAIYCLIKNWVDNGCPKGKETFSSFSEWASVCGGIMDCAGLGNPCKKSENDLAISSDTETEEMKTLFEICFESSPNVWLKKTDIKDIIIKSKELIFGYMDFDSMSDQVKFGKKIERFVDRILSDIKFICKDFNVRSARREYKFVKEISTFNKKMEDLN
jgi:hypothetical protein